MEKSEGKQSSDAKDIKSSLLSNDKPRALVNDTGLIVDCNDSFCELVDMSSKKLIKNTYITDLTKFENPAILLEAVHELDELFNSPFGQGKSSWKALMSNVKPPRDHNEGEEYYCVIQKQKEMMKQGHHHILEAVILPTSELNPSKSSGVHRESIRKSAVDIPAMDITALTGGPSSDEKSSVAKKVLIVDDSPTALKIMGKMVQRLGHETVMASDGLEALEKLRTQTFDIVIMDINMPKMNGLQAAHEFRKIEEERNRFYGTKSKCYLKVIALSGDISNTLFHEVTNAGFDTFIPKPLTEAKFLEVLNMPNPVTETGRK